MLHPRLRLRLHLRLRLRPLQWGRRGHGGKWELAPLRCAARRAATRSCDKGSHAGRTRPPLLLMLLLLLLQRGATQRGNCQQLACGVGLRLRLRLRVGVGVRLRVRSCG